MAAEAKRIVVTGANKGIGLAIVKAIIAAHPDSFVFLGSRNLERGLTAWKEELNSSSQVEVLEIDVESQESVKKAAKTVKEKFPEEQTPLYGLCCNAGIAQGTVKQVCDVNAYGVEYCCRFFLPLLNSKSGRISITSSAAGPSYVAGCTPEMQKFFCSKATTWKEVDELMQGAYKVQAAQPELDAYCQEKGIMKMDLEGWKGPYYFSKACLNAYALGLSNNNPSLKINTCTPGFIKTDLVLAMAAKLNKNPDNWNLKTPSYGAQSTMKCLFGDVSTGHYFGSDSIRSPLHKYRDPGDAEYTGGDFSQ